MSRKRVDWDEFVFRWGLNPIKKVKDFWRFVVEQDIPRTFWLFFHFFLGCIPIISRLEWELEVKIFRKITRR